MFRKTSQWFSSLHYNHKQIVFGLSLVILYLVAAKSLALIKEIVIAKSYGASAAIDTYVLAFTIATWLPSLLISVATSIIVPTLVKLPHHSHERSSFIAELNGTALIAGISLAVLTALFGSMLLRSLGITPTEISIMPLFATLSLFTLIIGLSSIYLQANQKYVYTALEAVPAFAIIVIISIFFTHSIVPLLWATLFGIALQATLSCLLSRQEIKKGIMFSWSSPQWQSVRNAFGAMAIGQFIISMHIPIDQYAAAQIGEGAIATLGYANKILMLVTSLGAIAISRAFLPIISNTVAKGELELGHQQTIRWTWILFSFGAFCALLGWLFALQGVAILFERGEFTRADTLAVSEILRLLLLQLPFYLGGIVLVQLMAANAQYLTLAKIAAITIACKIMIIYPLIITFNVAGIALATSVSYAIAFALQFYTVQKKTCEKSHDKS